MHDAPRVRRRSNNNTVGRTGSFHFRCPTPLWQGRRQRRDGGGWDGDDVRVWTRLRRKLRRRLWLSSSLTGPRRRSAAQSTVLALQLIVYFCQIATTIIALQRQFPSYWQTPRYACGMVIDAITGSTVVAHSPVVRAFGFRATIATSSTRLQNVYRYLTSGFVHSGLLPLCINVGVMLRLQPLWLARSLGASLYWTTFLCSIIVGNMAQVYNTTSTGGGFLAYDFITYLGSSAGICGLYGLMLVCLIRMGKANPNNNSAWLEHVTVAMNLGGYVGGLLLGMLCGPGYTKDYRMTRKNSVGYDPVDREYRAVMGFGILPTARGWLPVPVLQAILLTIFLVVPHYRTIPVAITKGVWNLL